MATYNYNLEDKKTRIKIGAHNELIKRNWHKGVQNNHDGQWGLITFEFGKNILEHHIAIKFNDGEEVGFSTRICRNNQLI